MDQSAWQNVPFIPAGQPWPDPLIVEVTDGVKVIGVRLVPDTSAQEAMLHHLERCWAVLRERSAKYDEAWLKRGALMNLLESAKKMDRLMAQFWDRGSPQHGDTALDLDDMTDLINYMLATLYQASIGEWTHG